MTGFQREDLSFSLCGLNCALCPMQLGGHCPGCGGGAGNQPCAIARCSLEHGTVSYCWQCADFPCERSRGDEPYDSFITHLYRRADLERCWADAGGKAVHPVRPAGRIQRRPP